MDLSFRPRDRRRIGRPGHPRVADTVRDLLHEQGFVERKAQKRLSMGATPFRNEQFGKYRG